MTNTITDQYGHTVTQTADGTWTRGGITVGPCDADTAKGTLDAHAPEGWSPPAAPIAVPQTISNYQFRAILMAAPSTTPGQTLFDLVDAALKARGGIDLQAWEYSPTATRAGALAGSVAALLGLEPVQVDEMFILAAGISA